MSGRGFAKRVQSGSAAGVGVSEAASARRRFRRRDARRRRAGVRASFFVYKQFGKRRDVNTASTARRSSATS